MKTLLELKNIQCRYDGQIAVDDLSLHVRQGDIFCLLGPSGCGKTTALRAIAGFEPVSAGEILIEGECVSRPGRSLPPEKRRLGMVFQDYALFPHLDLGDNITFGLRGEDKSERRRRAEELLETVGLTGYAGRFPHELSGGQQQRVALARALAPEPRMILMDEPFSNLDVELRERLGGEVRAILKARGITALMVTHDQHEAFAIGDQIGVMREGRLLQRDTAFNLYHEPAERFVAEFIGQGAFVKGTLEAPDTIVTVLGVIQGNRAYEWPRGSMVEVLIRPDDIVADAEGPLIAKVVGKAFKGAETLYTLEMGGGERLLSLFPSHHDHAIGEQVRVRLQVDHLVAFPA